MRHLCDVGDNCHHLADVGIGHADSKEISVLLDSALLIALLGYLDMCWSFFVARAYIMLILLIKSVKKSEHKQQTFSVELNFKFPHPSSSTAVQVMVVASQRM